MAIEIFDFTFVDAAHDFLLCSELGGRRSPRALGSVTETGCGCQNDIPHKIPDGLGFKTNLNLVKAFHNYAGSRRPYSAPASLDFDGSKSDQYILPSSHSQYYVVILMH